jgi:Predicted Zn-dependent peptidases
MLFKGTSYEWPIIGFRDTVSKITEADIHRYVAEHYQPQSMLLSVVGKVDPQAVLARAEAVFGGMANTTAEIEAQPFPLRDIQGPKVTLVPGKWNKVYLGVAFPLPDQNSAQTPGLELLAQVLGGDETSRLYREFKYERRMVDEIDCQAMTLARAASFTSPPRLTGTRWSPSGRPWPLLWRPWTRRPSPTTNWPEPS